jgi:hypothetical protein
MKWIGCLQGKVVDVKDEGFLHKIEYDDEVTEWLPLSSERFTLLTPRTTSAGCTTQLLVSLPLPLVPE